MKRYTLVSFLLCLSAASAHDYDGSNVIDRNSSRREVRNEFRYLNNQSEKIADEMETLTRLCDSMQERARALNDWLASRQAELASLLSQRDGALASLSASAEALEGARADAAAKRGRIAGIEERAALLLSQDPANSLARAQDSVRLEIQRQKRYLNEALRKLSRARLASSRYEEALSSANQSKEALAELESRLSVLSDSISADPQTESQDILEGLPRLRGGLAGAEAALMELQGQYDADYLLLKTALLRLARLPSVDEVVPIEIPVSCSRL